MEYCEGGIVDDVRYIKKHNIDVNDVCIDEEVLSRESILLY